MKVQLIINGQTADLNEDGLILLTYQSTDAEHPAAVKNSYSQNITLPSTPYNDKIFSHILRSDFRTGAGFNPLARTPFEIRNEAQEKLVSGYLKLNSGEVGKGYDISLFGGLGGFFYGLMYNNDGTKRTLADLEWKDGTFKPASNISINISTSAFASRYNGSFDANKPYAFAPFYEGLPDDFDADKAYYRNDETSATPSFVNDDPLAGIQLATEIEGKQYRPKNGTGKGILIDFSGQHDSWAMQEFRNTLQRPLWSIKAFLDAICQSDNNGGFDVFMDQSFYDSNFVKKGWVTLKNEWGAKVSNNTVTFADLLSDTQSPADYLLSLAKIAGLMFAFDDTTKRVQILTRDAYYGRFASRRFSLHGLVAEDRGKTITPLLTSDKWQVLSAENYGGKAEDYADRKGRQYGSLWLNTNYEFGGNEKEVLSESVFKGAADILASSIDYRIFKSDSGGSIEQYLCKFKATDKVSWNLYTQADSQGNQDSTTLELDTFSPKITEHYNAFYDFAGITELPQFCDIDGKNEDGNDVILFYAGQGSFRGGTGTYTTWAVKFYATDTPSEMLELNGGKPCWNWAKEAGNRVTAFPIFRRQLTTTWGASFARPTEFYTPNTSFANSVPTGKWLGERTWKKWLTERCDVDVRRMKCWVNLRSAVLPKVSADLLSYFWHYEGAWWVLDKINAHSLTTDDLTECEFIKVIDIDNYLEGQDYG